MINITFIFLVEKCSYIFIIITPASTAMYIHTQALSLFFRHTHTNSPFSISPSHTYTHIHTHSTSLSFPHTHIHTLFLTHSHSLSLFLSHAASTDSTTDVLYTIPADTEDKKALLQWAFYESTSLIKRYGDLLEDVNSYLATGTSTVGECVLMVEEEMR